METGDRRRSRAEPVAPDRCPHRDAERADLVPEIKCELLYSYK